MLTLLIMFHVFICIIMVIAVLLQQGQGSDLSSVFGGGGGASPIMSGRAALSLLNKITIACFVLFLITSLAISIVYRRQLEQRERPPEIPVPTAPVNPSTPGSPTPPQP